MNSNALPNLLLRIEEVARRSGLPLDSEAYAASGRDPFAPILHAGSLYAKIAVLGRDLGGQEVRMGEPLIGDAGRRVRSALYEAVTGRQTPPGDRFLHEAMAHALFTNTVPYKPVGNKCYSPGVREQFRPFIEELLVLHWKGDSIITLGTEAFKWFAPYIVAPDTVEAIWSRSDRYEAEVLCHLPAHQSGHAMVRPVRVLPLPHPSPLNRRYWSAFPELLRNRIDRLGLER